MKLAFSVNKSPAIVAELMEKGYLGAHLNLRYSESEGERGSIHVSGYDVSDESVTKFYRWPEVAVHSGDEVSISLGQGLDPTPPSSIKDSSENASYDSLTYDQAKKIIEVLDEKVNGLTSLLTEMKGLLAEADYKIFSLSVGHTLATLHEKIQKPIYRCHPSLRPEALKDQPL